MDQESDDRSEDAAVGYRRPPKRTQWQKGQCGNPTRKRKSAPRGAAEIIDQLFAKRFKVTENGSPRTASGLEVIITRLISKEIRRPQGDDGPIEIPGVRPSPEGGA
jgi:Family of unknown function (DUF5681)